jgi:signal transduction histidine kinase
VIGQSALLSAELFVDVSNWTISDVAIFWAIAELAMRAPRWASVAGVAVATVSYGMHDWPSTINEPFTELFGISIGIGMPFLIGAYIRASQQLAQRTAEQANQQMQQVRAEERTSIAREIHDLVAHHVASIVLRVAVARNVLTVTDPRVREVLDDVHSTGTNALADLRKLVTVLRDPGTPRQMSFVDADGLTKALEAAVERSRQIGLTVNAIIDPKVTELDSRTALALLRLVQEGLANVAKHAGDTAHATLKISVTEKATVLELKDFGGTPSTMATPGTKGHGLVGLKERIEVLGGTLSATPESTGWQLTARVPS